MRVAVVVLGDLGRSPRMMYHVRALARHGVSVDFIGYRESALPIDLDTHPLVVVHHVGGPVHRTVRPRRGWMYLAQVCLRGLSLGWRLAATLLWRTRTPDAILVQNPPGLPTLAVAWVAARARGATFAIDWHNLTHSMLALRLGPAHPFVRMVGWYEHHCGGRADRHLFVSAAMASALQAQWGLAGVVFRDGPADAFRPISSSERDAWRERVRAQLGFGVPDASFALAVSPTSWTDDEDFDLLLEAAALCDDRVRQAAGDGVVGPDLVILVTGRGPNRARYEALLRERAANHVHVRTAWLAAEDYPKVLAAADLGISLHRSTSGLDLPMKVADMLGAGVPVCALDYGPCLGEIVRPGDNGVIFSTAAELADRLFDLFWSPDQRGASLLGLRERVTSAPPESWPAAWERVVWPYLRRHG